MPGRPISKAFAERMNSLSPFEVKEAEHGDEVKPNRILIAPGGRHMEIEPKNSGFRVVISDGDPVNRHRPSVDVLFDSVARNVGKRAIGVILTGMGNDGAHGLKRMRDAGARTVAQDEASSVVFGMPREAIRLEAAMAVKPLDEIAELLVSWMGQRAAA